jgi:hypothetical protein
MNSFTYNFRAFIGGLVLLALVLFLCARADAATVTGVVTTPVNYVDGSALPLSAIKHLQVEVGTCASVGTAATFGTKEGESLVVPVGANTTYTVTSPRAFGDFCVRVRTVTTLGTVGDYTPAAYKTIAEPKPNPPMFTIATIAYELREYSGGTLRFVQIGTVPLGVQCGNKLVGQYADFTGATITKPVTGGRIAAKCG